MKIHSGRSKGGHTRADQLGHEGFVEMGRKGGLASHGADPYQLAAHLGRDIDEKKFMSPEAIAELERRAAAGETVVPGGTGGHTLEAQKHLAQGNTHNHYYSILSGRACSIVLHECFLIEEPSNAITIIGNRST